MSTPPPHPSPDSTVPPFVCFCNCLRERKGAGEGEEKGKGGKEGEGQGQGKRPEIHLPRCPQVVYCLGLRKANCWKEPHSSLALGTHT